MMRYTGFNIFRARLPQFVILSLFCFSYIGLLPLYFGWDEYRLEVVNNKDVLLKVLQLSSISIFSIYLGALFSRNVLGGIGGSYSSLKGSYIFKERYLLLVSWLFVCVVLFVYINKVSHVALFVAISGSPQEVMIARSRMTNAFSGYHWFSLVIHHLANIVTFSWFAACLQTKKIGYKIILIPMFMVSVFTSVMSTEKAPIVWFFFGLAITYVLVRRNGVYPIKFLVLCVFVSVSLLSLSYIFFMSDSDVGSALLSVFSRAFAGSIQPAYHYLEYFPGQHDFLMGRSFPNPGGVFPIEPFYLTAELMSWVYPESQDLEKGMIGTMPAVFWAEIYANFGLAPTVIIPFFIGMFLYCIDHVFTCLLDTSIKVGVYVWMMLHFKDLSVTGISSYLFDFYLFFIIGFFLVVLLFIDQLAVKKFVIKV